MNPGHRQNQERYETDIRGYVGVTLLEDGKLTDAAAANLMKILAEQYNEKDGELDDVLLNPHKLVAGRGLENNEETHNKVRGIIFDEALNLLEEYYKSNKDNPAKAAGLSEEWLSKKREAIPTLVKRTPFQAPVVAGPQEEEVDVDVREHALMPNFSFLDMYDDEPEDDLFFRSLFSRPPFAAPQVVFMPMVSLNCFMPLRCEPVIFNPLVFMVALNTSAMFMQMTLQLMVIQQQFEFESSFESSVVALPDLYDEADEEESVLTVSAQPATPAPTSAWKKAPAPFVEFSNANTNCRASADRPAPTNIPVPKFVM